jgi:hypothetical protein
MDGQDNRLLLERYLAGRLDSEQEYALRHEDVVIDMPQSGERIRGRDNMKAMQDAYPGPPEITVRRIVGSGDVWVVEGRADYSGRIYYVVSPVAQILRQTPTTVFSPPWISPACQRSFRIQVMSASAHGLERAPARTNDSPTTLRAC